ncbi:MAG: DNA primase [Deltaproteobacteria bacterium]|jgi:DNA primase|nr:DNA primase [Deltaproteobacteria bacterium]
MRRSDAIQAIKERLNLVDIARRYLDLKRSGTRWTAPCPFHQETKPSFSINEETGLFHCFGCNASGDLFSFYGRINNLDFSECLEHLAAEAGIELDARGRGGRTDGGARHRQQEERRRIERMHEFAATHYARNLAGPNGAACREYMERRGIDKALAEKFGLGWAMPDWRDLADALRRSGFDEALAVQAGLLGKSEKDGRARVYDRFRGRLIFPIRNPSNQVIAFGGRIIEDSDEAKYINSAASAIYKKGEHLYALPQARGKITIKGSVLLAEGYMDVLTLHQFGYEHAVGALGTALTPAQAKRLELVCSQVVVVFDGDAAGRKAAQRACELLLPRGLACRVAVLPQGQDVDEFLRQQGPEELDKVLEAAPDGLQYCLDVVKRHMAPREAVAWARAFLKNVGLAELFSRFASTLARELDLNEADLRAEAFALHKAAARPGKKAPSGAVVHHDLAAKGVAGVGSNAASIGGQDLVLERQILRLAARYPHRCGDLLDAGADLYLRTSWARAFWEKFLAHPAKELELHLDEEERKFWMNCLYGEAPPAKNEEGELAPLLQIIATRHKQTANRSFSAALRKTAGTGDFEGDMEYIRALRATQRMDDEQS